METLSIQQQPTLPANHVWTKDELQELLDKHTRYQPNGVGSEWKWVVKQLDYNHDGGWDKVFHVRVEWVGADNVTGKQEVQQSRWWVVSKHARKNEVMSTAFACVKMAVEHELREQFNYRTTEEGPWSMPYNTHTDVDALATASEIVDIRVDSRPNAPKNQRRE